MLSSVSHAARSAAHLQLEAGSGGAVAAGATAMAAGAGSSSTINLVAAGAGLRIGATVGTNFVYGDVSRISPEAPAPVIAKY